MALSSAIKIPSALVNLVELRLGRPFDDSATNLSTPHAAAACRRPNTPAFSPKEDISSLLPQLHGRADWSSLLTPQLHPCLRREIIKYGELAQATYDSFDFNPFSEFCGSCLYGRHRLLAKLGLDRSGYVVTKYLYAMSHVDLPRWLERSLHADAWDTQSNWIGFVAVSDDDESRRIGCRDIVVAWRGTVSPTEWAKDVEAKLVPCTLDGGGGGKVKVEYGFLSAYTSAGADARYNKTSASEQVMAELRRLVEHYKSQGEEVCVTITGHSLGGALALLNAYEAAAALEREDVPVSAITFAGPRVGNKAFGKRLRKMRAKVLRLVVKQDVVPRVPGVLFNEDTMGMVGSLAPDVYMHAGVELELSVGASPFLKQGVVDVGGFHGLETYLHLVDGFVCSASEFRGGARRDVALVNKRSGMLNKKLRIPPKWAQEANKGLVLNAYGRWVKPVREAEDIPSPFPAAVGGRR